jgi:hypothetical protein
VSPISFLTGTQAELLFSMPAAGAAVSGTVTTGTAALVTPVGGATAPAYFLPAYFFSDSYGTGKSILIQGGGTLANGATTETLQLGLYLDTAVGTPGTVLCRTGAFSPFGASTAQTGAFMFEVLITAASVGTAGVLNAVGRVFTGQAGTTGTAGGSVFLMGSSSEPTINNATGYYVELYASFGATTTSQTVTLTNMLVWGLN